MLAPYRQQFATEGAITLAIRARPNARVTKVVAVFDDGSIKIDLHAPAEDGAANEELVRFLAEEFGVALSHVELLSGFSSRHKVIRLTS